ncbi:MAG: PDDEXK nuclease domain-containing protein [Opitutaceae bacterium]
MPRSNSLYTRIRQILESARIRVARSVNTTQVVANWLIGREIVEEEQKGRRRAGYGDRLVRDLSKRLGREFGAGCGLSQLKDFRSFYLAYDRLLDGTKSRAVRGFSVEEAKSHTVRGFLEAVEKGYTPRSLSEPTISATPSRKLNAPRSGSSGLEISNALRSESGEWKPGRLNPNLSWTHYRTLMRVDRRDARAFYEIEAVKEFWSARELDRQIASLLFERLAKSRDKAGVMRLATKGHEITSPADIFKDPVVIEFLGLPESHRLAESDLEQALLDQLQSFLLELGKGFAFVARQQRLTLEGDHFYIDLVFYHVVLKCYVLLDLKIGKLTHGDLGQLQLYVNYYDREKRTADDNPTLGLILCTDKNDAVVKYTLGADQEKTIFASRYKLHLPSEAELKAEVRRELKHLASSAPSS